MRDAPNVRTAARIRIAPATGSRDVSLARRLLKEYAASLSIDLCFQGFDAELAGLPGDYAPPDGRLWIARVGGRPAGCVALRRFDRGRCEMKRLYLRPAYRGRGLGRRLVATTLATGRRLGYRRMVLDTLPSMMAALAVYDRFGFRRIRPYRFNPVPGAVYLERSLRPTRTDRGVRAGGRRRRRSPR